MKLELNSVIGSNSTPTTRCYAMVIQSTLAGKVLTSTDPLGHTTRTVYDSFARPYKTIFADGSFTEMGYDSRGRKAFEREQRLATETGDANVRQTDYEYDDLGRLTAVVQPDLDLSAGVLRPRYEYTYDRFGNHVQTKDALNRVTQFAYDFAGRQTSRTLPAAGGQKNVETWDYSDSTEVGLGLYPNVGMLKRHTDFNDNKEEPHYDDRGRVDVDKWYKPIRDVNGTITGYTLDQQVNYHYDTRGRMDNYTDSRGTTTYGFDIESRVTQITMPEGQLNYEYDQTNGWQTRTYVVNNTITGNSGAINEDTTYSYDQAGRLEKISATKLGNVVSNLVTTYGYNELGLVTTVLRKNNNTQVARTVNTYDTMNRLQTMTQKDNTDAIFEQYTYTRRSDGKIAHVLEHPVGGVTTGDVNRDFVYDTLGRLNTETVVDGGGVSGGGSGITSYAYDLVGNRQSKASDFGTTNYLYDGRDRLLTETGPSGTTSYSYDSNGSQTFKDVPGSNDQTYTWDARNRLSGAILIQGGGNTTTSYKYDDSGIRTQQNETVTPQIGQPTTTNRKQLVDSMNPTGYAQVIEETAGGVLLVSTVYGMEPVAEKVGANTSIYLADGHSGTRFMVNVLTNVMNALGYDAFGNLTSGTMPSGEANPVGYRGERQDLTLQLYNNRARFYNPASGRFARIDALIGSLRMPSSQHGYAYSANEGINNIDPSGNSFVSLAVGAIRMLGPTIFARDIILTFLSRALSGLATSVIIQLLAKSYIEPIIDELPKLSVSLLRLPIIGPNSANVINEWYRKVVVFYRDITTKNTIRPIIDAQLGPVVNAVSALYNGYEVYKVVANNTKKLTNEAIAIYKAVLPPAIRNAIGQAAKGFSIEYKWYDIVTKGFTGQLDPAGDIRTFREGVDNLVASQWIPAILKLHEMIKRLEIYAEIKFK